MTDSRFPDSGSKETKDYNNQYTKTCKTRIHLPASKGFLSCHKNLPALGNGDRLPEIKDHFYLRFAVQYQYYINKCFLFAAAGRNSISDGLQ